MAATSAGPALGSVPPLRLRAGLIWPERDRRIVDGAVLTGADGRVVAVGADADVPAPAGVRSAHWPDAVLLPGFINAHTHLELHGLRGAIPEEEFFAWLQHIRRAKEALDTSAFAAAARAGLQEAWRHGTTYVLDTGTAGATARVLAEAGGAGVYFHEVIAPDPAGADAALAEAAAVVEAAETLPPRVAVGVSPHAPYTVSPRLVERAVQWARASGLPLAGHVAESEAEWAFVTAGEGAFGASWRRRGLPLPPPAASPVAYLRARGALASDYWVIHGVRLTDEDIRYLASERIPVALCPRSNRRHGHGFARMADLHAAGVPLGIGTDSVASVDDLDVLAEARVVAHQGKVDPVAVLGMLTWDVGRTIGNDVGALRPGGWADVVVLACDRAEGADAQAAAVLDGGAAAVRATVASGRCVYSDDPAILEPDSRGIG
jgi:5-methylthioadenosine/S-adenosylhomocysteine deaminase